MAWTATDNGPCRHQRWNLQHNTIQYNTIRCRPRKQCRKTHGKGVCEYIQNNRARNRKPNAQQPYSSLEFYPAGQFYNIMIIWKAHCPRVDVNTSPIILGRLHSSKSYSPSSMWVTPLTNWYRKSSSSRLQNILVTTCPPVLIYCRRWIGRPLDWGKLKFQSPRKTIETDSASSWLEHLRQRKISGEEPCERWKV